MKTRCSEHDLQEQVLLGLLARNAERAKEAPEDGAEEDEDSEYAEPRLKKKSAKARKVV